MAEQKPRAPRARKKTADVEPVAATSAPKRKAASTAKRREPQITPTVGPADVAVRAYLLWEQGEPGDADEHWLRAEQELLAA
jgi:hypothetical protein